MFSQPKARIARALGMLSKIKGIGQRISGGKTLTDIGKVENGEFHHGVCLPYPRPSVSFYVQAMQYIEAGKVANHLGQKQSPFIRPP